MEDINSGGAPLAQHHDQRFSYRQLDYSKREFRLLMIKTPYFNTLWKTSRPRCTIKNFSLQSAPPYKAVSYRWGKSLSSREILVNGLPLEISENLSDFFSQDRLVEQVSRSDNGWLSGQWPNDPITKAKEQWATAPWLWIDQLCIDQSSIDEKNHQVAQMGAIFSEAIEVLVWLGKGTDDTEEAVKVAAYSAQRFQRTNLTMSDLQAFQKIVSNQYWSRLWIIQEFVLARTVVIISGSEQVSGAHFRELARDVAQSDESLAIARIWPFMTARRRLTAAYMLKRMASLDASTFYGPDLQYTWQDVMRLAKKAECRDVRDRAYGMLSMVRHQVRINVDYTASTRRIREKIIEKEFMVCFDRAFSQDALEEVRDEDFERFLGDLDSALELNDAGVSAEDPPTTSAYCQHHSQMLASQEQDRLAIPPEMPRSGVSRQIGKGSRLSRGLAKMGIRRPKGYK